MKKKLLSFCFLGIIMLSVSACDKVEKIKYAVIENVASSEEEVCAKSAWEGVQKYAYEYEEKAAWYEVEGTEREHYSAAIEKAVEDGAKVVVCVGDEFSVPVYNAQNDYRRVKFILLNANPHKLFSKKPNIASNTVALHFDDNEKSFLAGYVAVANGARDIGFMGGEETTESKTQVAGFVKGAETAAADLQLSEGAVKVRLMFTGEDKLSPAYMGKALTWYEDGCEVIFAPNEHVRYAVNKAAESAQKSVIGIGQASMTESSSMLTAVYADYANAVYQQLTDIEAEIFEGAQSLLCGTKENGVGVVTKDLDDSAINHFKTIYQKLSSGEIKLDETDELPHTKFVMVDGTLGVVKSDSEEMIEDTESEVEETKDSESSEAVLKEDEQEEVSEEE